MGREYEEKKRGGHYSRLRMMLSFFWHGEGVLLILSVSIEAGDGRLK